MQRRFKNGQVNHCNTLTKYGNHMITSVDTEETFDKNSASIYDVKKFIKFSPISGENTSQHNKYYL